ncbi:hypothetical protein SynBIOSE41_01530 [Synechococcus sp. BIOS-E4-1]|nr:hypothetical protein SynBIOSE41_01530 [Synechococcus sp. BIOS-E4-1]
MTFRQIKLDNSTPDQSLTVVEVRNRERSECVALVKPSLVLTSPTCLIRIERRNLHQSNQANRG